MDVSVVDISARVGDDLNKTRTDIKNLNLESLKNLKGYMYNSRNIFLSILQRVIRLLNFAV